MIVDPYAVASRHPDPPIRTLARLAIDITTHPSSLTNADLERARAGGLEDAGILHAVMQTSLFGHFNRIADAVGVESDYPNTFAAPHVEPATPPYLWPTASPDPHAPRPIDLASRPGAIDAIGAWRAQALERDTPLTHRQRGLIAHAVAERLGDATVPAVFPRSDLDRALVDLADLVTLAPWKLAPEAYEAIRSHGLADDAEVFDAVATASSCGVFSRISVTLAAFAQ